MRTLGPRSVSSVFKIILDIVFVLLCLAALALGVHAMLSALAIGNPAPFGDWTYPDSRRTLLADTPREIAQLMRSALHVLGLIVVVGQLRSIFAALTAGHPFQSDNARRVRVIGLALAAIEGSNYLVWGLMANTLPDAGRFLRPEIDLTGWFGIAILFVLAEVLEEGARLRRDADLTI